MLKNTNLRPITATPRTRPDVARAYVLAQLAVIQVTPEQERQAALTVAASVPKDEVLGTLQMLGLAS